MRQIEGPKKGTPFGMCRHTLETPIGDLHWYLEPDRRHPRRPPKPYEWVCVCPACHASAERDPSSPLPVYAVGRLQEDIVIDQQGEN